MATAPGVAHGTRPRKVLTGRQVAPDRVISTVAWHLGVALPSPERTRWSFPPGRAPEP